MALTMYHTGFVVEDMERAVRFYTEGVGLTVDVDMDLKGYGLQQVVGYDDAHIHAVMLKANDGHILELLQYLTPRGERREQDQQYPRALIGAAHLGFMVDDADATLQRCLELGGTQLNPVVQAYDTVRACYLQDPDGNWIELVQDEVQRASPFTVTQNRTRPFD